MKKLRNNIKLLTNEEKTFLKDKFEFSLIGDYVCVRCKSYDRQVIHSIHQTFSINSKVRKVSFTPIAVKNWIDSGFENNLIDVQQAVNYLDLTNQEVNLDSIRKVINTDIVKLNRPSNKSKLNN